MRLKLSRQIPCAPSTTSQVTKRGMADLALHNLPTIPHRRLERHQVSILTASPRVSGMNRFPSNDPVEADREFAAERLFSQL